MKKIFFFAAGCLALASCSTEGLVDDWFGDSAKEGPISFVMQKKNMVRSTTYSDLQETHYNFGVFAYKNTDKENNIMANYLVGYMDEANKKGYKLNLASQTTLGDKEGLADGQSYWQYEGLGNTEYSYADNEGYYKASETEFMSNVDKQYLRYWDLASGYTCFYAYAPYINGANTAAYVDGTAVGSSNDTYVLTIPNGTLTAGYDDPTLAEYMYASTKVEKANYGHDVALQFKRLNAKVNIKFWEDIPGYSVRILDLSSSKEGVQAAASIVEAGQGNYGYRAGKYYTANGVKIQFANGNATGMKQYEGTLATNTTPLVFQAPTVNAIGETRFEAAKSPTTYYAIPKGDGNEVLTSTGVNFGDTQAADTDLAKTGFTFHVTYELTSTTGERIVVNNATVHVPYEYCNWKYNTHYTYIFKITRNTNGSTLDPTDPNSPAIDPTDPEVPTVQALYPIVFDNCTVEDWDENESEWVITEGTVRNYHNISLNEYSFKSDVEHVLNVGITDDDTHASHDIDWSAVTVAGPDLADENSWYNATAQTITVPVGAAAGVYTITYTCPAGDINANHPAKWTQTFLVGNDYAVTTNLNEVGTGGLAATKLAITTTKDNTSVTAASGQLYIEYPANFTDDGKVKVVGQEVVIAADAQPGAYKLVYKVDEPTAAKVDEVVFNVKKYNYVLTPAVVFLGATAQEINANVTGTGVISMETVPTGVTVTDATKKISVANTTAEGEYEVLYTIYGETTDPNHVSTVQYKQKFTVKNTHAVAVSKNTIDRNEGATGSMTIGTDYITISTLLNGVATTGDDHLALKIVDAAGNDVTAQFTITYTSANEYKLQVYKTTAAGNYKVVYTKPVYNSGNIEEVAAFRVVE